MNIWNVDQPKINIKLATLLKYLSVTDSYKHELMAEILKKEYS